MVQKFAHAYFHALIDNVVKGNKRTKSEWWFILQMNFRLQVTCRIMKWMVILNPLVWVLRNTEHSTTQKRIEEQAFLMIDNHDGTLEQIFTTFTYKYMWTNVWRADAIWLGFICSLRTNFFKPILLNFCLIYMSNLFSIYKRQVFT